MTTDISRHPMALTARALRVVAAALTIWAGSTAALTATAQAGTTPTITLTPPPVIAATSATIRSSLTPDKLGAKAALSFTIHYTGGAYGVPSPVRRSTLRFPAGLRLSIPKLLSCNPARLRAHGSSGCPAQALVGHGHALEEVHAGSLTITEDVTLSAFLGPLKNGQPTLAILGQGYSPFEQRVVLSAEVLSASAPYGEELVMSIPAIPTLPYVPDASMASFSLTIGASEYPRKRRVNTVIVPASCPLGGFPFSAEFTYANGSSGSALATAACP